MANTGASIAAIVVAGLILVFAAVAFAMKNLRSRGKREQREQRRTEKRESKQQKLYTGTEVEDPMSPWGAVDGGAAADDLLNPKSTNAADQQTKQSVSERRFDDDDDIDPILGDVRRDGATSYGREAAQGSSPRPPSYEDDYDDFGTGGKPGQPSRQPASFRSNDGLSLRDKTGYSQNPSIAGSERGSRYGGGPKGSQSLERGSTRSFRRGDDDFDAFTENSNLSMDRGGLRAVNDRSPRSSSFGGGGRGFESSQAVGGPAYGERDYDVDGVGDDDSAFSERSDGGPAVGPGSYSAGPVGGGGYGGYSGRAGDDYRDYGGDTGRGYAQRSDVSDGYSYGGNAGYGGGGSDPYGYGTQPKDYRGAAAGYGYDDDVDDEYL